MSEKHIILKGAFILTAVGFINRIIGFFYRIFLSQAIGAEGMGIYQLIFPVYAMTFSLAVSGIQTSISKYVAAKNAVHDRRGSRNVLFAGTSLSLGLSILVTWLLYTYAVPISEYVLMEPRCASLLKLIAWSIPFRSIHACITGYYYGLKRTSIPAVTQLLEQITRVTASYATYMILLERGLPITPVVAVVGMVAEEVVSSLFSVTALLLHLLRPQKNVPVTSSKTGLWGSLRSILALSIPLSGNRVLLNILQSVEAVCIPQRLRLFGLSTGDALSVYGVLTGMALPLILFPSAITGSVSIMLLPAVSEAQARGERRQIIYTIENALRYSLLLGILCTGIFLAFGEDMGVILFHEESAGSFILTLSWICPFLYLGTTMSSILNGLGKTVTSFLQNTAALLVRIFFAWFAVPSFGITGYLWGVLASELLTSFAAIYVLRKDYDFHFDSHRWIVKPVWIILLSGGIMLCFKKICSFFPILQLPIPSLLFPAAVMTVSYLFLLWPDLRISIKSKNLQ